MNLFAYIRYFSFLAYNWNLRIALHLIQQEVKGERKYGINSTGAQKLFYLKKRGVDISHATIYMPVSYLMLDDVFNQIPLSSRNHFVDIGCGKGRALCLALIHGFNKVTGIDFSRELCNVAKLNLAKVHQYNTGCLYEVINNDAFYFDVPKDTDCIFLFNPFDEIILSGVVKNINQSLRQYPRTLRVIYANPVYKELFTDAGFNEIYHTKKLKYLELSILCNK